MPKRKTKNTKKKQQQKQKKQQEKLKQEKKLKQQKEREERLLRRQKRKQSPPPKPKKEEPKKEAPKPEPKKEEPRKAILLPPPEPKKETPPPKPEPKKEEPKKEAPKKEEPKKEKKKKKGLWKNVKNTILGKTEKLDRNYVGVGGAIGKAAGFVWNTYKGARDFKKATEQYMKKNILYNNSSALSHSAFNNKRDVINKWNSNRNTPNRGINPYAYNEAVKDAINKQNELIMKNMREAEMRKAQVANIDPFNRPPPDKDEYGKTIDILSDTFIPRPIQRQFNYMSNQKNKPMTREEEMEKNLQENQARTYNKQYYIKNMEKLKAAKDNPNKFMEERIKDISDDYKLLIDNETHSFISHPEDILLKDATEKAEYNDFMRKLNFGVHTAADILTLANGSKITETAISKIIGLFKKGYNRDMDNNETEAIMKMVKKFNDNVDKAQETNKEITERIKLHNKNVERYKQIKKNLPDNDNMEIPDINPDEINDNNIKDIASYLETMDDIKRRNAHLFELMEKSADPKTVEKAKQLKGKWYNKAWDWIKNVGVKEVKEIATNLYKSEIQGKTKEEIAKDKYLNGDMIDDKFKREDDIMEFTLEDSLKNFFKNRKSIKELEKINPKEALAFFRLGYDPRYKEEMLPNVVLQQAHRAFIKGDENAKKELAIKGIRSTEDILKRKADLEEYAAITGKDSDWVNEEFNKRINSNEIQWNEQVIKPTNKNKANLGIDAATGIFNLYQEHENIINQGKDEREALIGLKLDAFNSREGTDAKANNNRTRDILAKTFKIQFDKDKGNLEASKMRNKFIATLTAGMAKDGYMNDEDEIKLLKEAEDFFKISGSYVFDDKVLTNQENIQKIYNQGLNFLDYRRNWMKAKGKKATQNTIKEVATDNKGQSYAVKTPGQQYEDMKKAYKGAMLPKFVNSKGHITEDIITYEEKLNEREQYEKDKRKAAFKTALTRTPDMITVMNQIDDQNKQKITLNKLKEMEDKIKTFKGNEQSIKEYAWKQNEKFNKEELPEEKIKTFDYAYLNDRDIMNYENYNSNKITEIKQNVRYKPNQQYKINTEELELNKPTKKDKNIFLKTQDLGGNEIITKINKKGNQELIKFTENNNNLPKINSSSNDEQRKIYNEGKEAYNKVLMNNPKYLNEISIKNKSDDTKFTRFNYDSVNIQPKPTPKLQISEMNEIDKPMIKENITQTRITKTQAEPSKTTFELAHSINLNDFSDYMREFKLNMMRENDRLTSQNMLLQARILQYENPDETEQYLNSNN